MRLCSLNSMNRTSGDNDKTLSGKSLLEGIRSVALGRASEEEKRKSVTEE